MKTLMCCLLLSFPVLVYSMTPKACQPLKIAGESLVLKTVGSELIFIHNLTKIDLWITHPVTRVGASAGWTSRIHPGNWSALVVDKKSFILNCVESRPGHEQQISCEGAIAVCQWKGAKIPAKQHSTYWAAEDMSLSAITRTITDRNIALYPNPKKRN